MSGLESWMKSAETTHRFYTQEVTVTPLHCLLLRSGTMPHCKTLSGTTVSDAFLLDEQRRVIQAWYKVGPKDTVPFAKKALGAGVL